MYISTFVYFCMYTIKVCFYVFPANGNLTFAKRWIFAIRVEIFILRIGDEYKK